MNGRIRRILLSLFLSLTLAVPLVPLEPAQTVQAAEAGDNSMRVIQIASSSAFTLALRADGTVWAWGQNDKHQLGYVNGDREFPVQVMTGDEEPLEHIVRIAAGSNFGAALDIEGNVWVWGEMDTTIEPARKFTLADFDNETITDIAAGAYYILALSDNGHVYAWGNGPLGRDNSASNTPLKVLKTDETPLEHVVQIAAAEDLAAAKTADGTVYNWYWFSSAGNKLAEPVFSGLSEDDPIFAGGYAAFLVKDGDVYGWGSYFQLGLPGPFDGGPSRYTIPTRIPELAGKNIIRISSSTTHSLALSANGQVYGTGDSVSGVLGSLWTPSVDTFTLIPELAGGVTGIEAGYYRTFFERGERLWAMGENKTSGGVPGALAVGYLDLGFMNKTSEPLPVMDLTENVPFSAKAPTRVSVTVTGPNSFQVDIEMPPFSVANRLFLEAYPLGEGGQAAGVFSEPIPVLSRWKTVYFEDVQMEPGLYEFKFFTAACSSEENCSSDSLPDSVTVDNGGKGFDIEDSRFELRIRLIKSNSQDEFEVGEYGVEIGSFCGESLCTYDYRETDNLGEVQFEDVPPDLYYVRVYNEYGDETFHDFLSFIYLDKDKDLEVRLRDDLDPEYSIDYWGFDSENAGAPSNRVTGWLYWYGVEAEENGIDGYRIHMFHAGGERLKLLDTVTKDVYDEYSYYDVFLEDVVIPDSAVGPVGLEITAYDSVTDTEYETGARIIVRSPLYGEHLEGRATDSDPEPGVAKKTIAWKGLADEEHITHYVLWSEFYGFIRTVHAVIPKNSGNGSLYSYTFGLKEYEQVLDQDLRLSVRYEWGMDLDNYQTIHPVDNILSKKYWSDDDSFDPDLQPVQEVESGVQMDGQGRIEGWLLWTDPDSWADGYEIVFLDADKNYLGSLLRVGFSDRVYIPKSPVPICAAYLGIYSYDWYGYSQVPAIIPLNGKATCPNLISSTAYGALDGSGGRITHIPNISVGMLTGELALPDGAKVSRVRYRNGMEPVPSYAPVEEGMLVYVENSEGDYRIYTLRTLRSALMEFVPSPNGRVDLPAILDFLSTEPPDFTGDGKLDEQDVRWLLEEIDPVVDPASF